MSEQHELLTLLQSQDDYISGEALAEKAGISRSAVWKHVKRLREYGYVIESRHGLGYRLANHTDLPLPWELKKKLGDSIFAKNIIFKKNTDSTQNLAISLSDKSDSHGTVVIAEQQSSGRGRQKRKWISPKGGVWLSFILKPTISISKITILPFIAADALCDSIRSLGLDAKLKWPNDVMISGKKVAGVLLDVSAETDQINYAVIGIGINANIDSAALSARLDGIKITSLSDELGKNINRLELTSSLLKNIQKYYIEMEQRGEGKILQQWRQNSDMLGKKVMVIQNDKTIQGIAKDINNDGSLLLNTEKGLVNISFGDISIRY